MASSLTDAERFAKMKAFEIFKPGTFTAEGGQVVNFTSAMLAEVASSYNPALHEAPMVAGHPKNDDPAYGWIRGVTYEDDRLMADPDQVDTAFADMVAAGRFKKRSASFYPPKHPGNPTPGKWHLKHVGFLGAVPPSVKGLKEVAFAEDEEPVLTIEFSDGERTIGWALRNMADMARGIRDYILTRDGEDVANKVIPTYQIDQMIADSTRIAVEAEAEPSFSEQPLTEDTVKLTQEQLDARQAELDAREAEIASRETAVQTQETSFSEAQKQTRRAAHALVLDQLIADGKFVPGMKVATLDFLDGLDAATTVEFGEGDGKTEATPVNWFLNLLKSSGTVVDFSERAAATDKDKEVVSFAAPDGATVDPVQLELHNKALAYQAKNPNVDYMDAVRAVNHG